MALVNGQYRVEFPIIQKLSTSGFEDGSNTNFNADYSVTDELAIIQAPAGLLIRVDTIQISITDNGVFDPTEYGNLVGGLTNGILTEVILNGVTVVNPNQTINNNAELFTTDSQAQIVEYAGGGGGDRQIISRFNFNSPIVLNGDTLDRIQLRLSDNFTGLTFHEFVAMGSQ